MGIYNFHNMKKLIKKSEQSEQEELTDCNSMDKSVSESRNKVGTKSEQSRNTKELFKPKNEEIDSHFNLLDEDEAIWMERMIRWVDRCEIGDVWEIPEFLRSKSYGLQKMADNAARNSRHGIRIWRSVKNGLRCHPWSIRYVEPSDDNLSGVVDTSLFD